MANSIAHSAAASASVPSRRSARGPIAVDFTKLFMVIALKCIVRYFGPSPTRRELHHPDPLARAPDHK
jgi:hypothetical protein